MQAILQSICNNSINNHSLARRKIVNVCTCQLEFKHSAKKHRHPSSYNWKDGNPRLGRMIIGILKQPTARPHDNLYRRSTSIPHKKSRSIVDSSSAAFATTALPTVRPHGKKNKPAARPHDKDNNAVTSGRR